MRNQTSFRLTTTLLPTDTSAKTTDVINKVDSCGCKFKPNFTEETVVLTNDDRTVMETTRAYSCNGALCFTKRGLSDDVTETEVANRKLTWNPGTLAFVTAGAGDWIDKDDNVTWSGNQTYTGTLTSTCSATYCGELITKKGVKYPSFADTTALEAYDSPFGGMFAVVEDTGELYRYNAVTCCWDMVSTVDLGTYEIRESCTLPASGTANTIVTLVDGSTERGVYLGETQVANTAHFADVLMIGGGGGGTGTPQGVQGVYCWGDGGGAGGIAKNYSVFLPTVSNVVVGKGGARGCDASPSADCFLGINGGDSCVNTWHVTGGGGGGRDGANGGGGACGVNPTFSYQLGGNNGGGRYTNGNCYLGGGGGGALCGGGNSYVSGCNWYHGAGGAGVCLEMLDGTCCFAANGGDSGGGTSDSYGSGGGWNSNGKDGIVQIRYPEDGSYGIHCATGGTVTCCCGYVTHTFTSDGTFTIVN